MRQKAIDAANKQITKELSKLDKMKKELVIYSMHSM